MPVATGGIITISGLYTIHTFLSDDDFTVLSPISCARLIIAGGGAGMSGGGGAGGVLPVTFSDFTVGIYPSVIGAGGVGGVNTNPSSHGGDGSNSTFNGDTAIGGGGGSGTNDPFGVGRNGGSGGGGGADGSANENGGTGTIGQGKNGGTNGGGANPLYPAGGGGGANAVGGNGTAPGNKGGDGGSGLASTVPGDAAFYGGGGGGGMYAGGLSAGGTGGGGAGSGSGNGTNGTANTGGGGGGAQNGGTSGNGGSGKIIVWYLTPVIPPTPNLDDQILREQVVNGRYKLEIAWGGNLTQTVSALGVRMASIYATGASDANYPSTKVIDGEEWHYDPTTDLYRNYWQKTGSSNSTYVTIYLGRQVTFNQLVIYFHPTLPGPAAFKVEGSNTSGTGPWTTIYSGAGTDPKVVMDLLSLSYTWLKFTPTSAGTDDTIRICELQVFNWIDESDNIVDKNPTKDGSEPAVTISVKGDNLQNALPTPSECSIELQNVDSRFSPTNSSSPIYGILQIDGQGSGIRSNVPVRVKVIASSIVGSFTKQVFFGFISNDDNPGGADGITLDDMAGTASIVAKSLFSRLTEPSNFNAMTNLNIPSGKTINVPVYEGANVEYIVKDIGVRSGIAWQDMSVQAINQGVPYMAFSQGVGQTMINQLLEALPFMRVYETYDPQWKLNFVNYGRTRTDISLVRQMTTSPGTVTVPKNMLCINSLNRMFIFDSNTAGTGNNRIWLWDMTRPTGGNSENDGVTQFGSNSALNTLRSVFAIGTTIYFVDSTGAVKHFDGSVSTLGSITSDGTFAGIDVGYNTFVTALNFGNFIYVVMSTGGGSNPCKLYVWDTTLAFATRVSVATLAHPMERARSNTGYGAVEPSGVAVDGTYFIYKYDERHINIWKHNGTPLATAYAGNNQDVSYFSATIIAGENYWNNAFAYSSTGLLGIAVAVHKVSGLFRHEIWTLDIASAYLAPSGNATYRGTIKDDTSDLIVEPGNGSGGFNDSFSILMNASYLYIQTVNYDAYVWDTNKDFSFLFQLGFNQPNGANFPPYQPSFQTVQQRPTSFGQTAAHVGPNINGIDSSSRIWYCKNGRTTPYGTFVGYNVQGAVVQDLTPDVSFSITDRFMINAVISRGNPIANRVKISSSAYALGTGTMALTSQSPDGIWVPSNKITYLSFPMTTLSWRGKGSNNARYFHCSSFNNPIPDDPTTTTTVTINGINYNISFFAFGDLGIMKIDTTGKVAIQIFGGVIWGQPVSQQLGGLVSLDVRDDASFRMYQREFLHEISNPAFNDYSFFQDILLNGKYAKPYIQAQDTPWYPIYTIGEIIQLTDSVTFLPATVFEVVEYMIQGYKTTMKAKKISSTVVI